MIGQILAKYCLLTDSSLQTPPAGPAPTIPVVTLSVVAIVAIAFSGPILILLVTVVVVPAGCCYYHKKTKKSFHEVVAHFQRLECMLKYYYDVVDHKMWSIQVTCNCSHDHIRYRRATFLPFNQSAVKLHSLIHRLLPITLLHPVQEIKLTCLL